MFNQNITFENIPKQILWDNGNIIQPALLYYEFQRLDVINSKRFLCQNPNFYGIKLLNISNESFINNKLNIINIECIFSDGTLFKKNFESDREFSINLDNIKANYNEELYIYIVIPECSSKNFILGKNDSRFQASAVDEVNETENEVIAFQTLEENVSLHIGSFPPVNYAYIPIAKFLNEEGNPHFIEFIPPSITIKSSDKLQLISSNLIELLKKKLEILKQDIDFIKNSENILSYIEKSQINICLKQAITNIQTILSLKNCTPEMFYNECINALSILSTANIIDESPENLSYQHENLNFIFDNITNKIETLLNQEISEKYRTYRFNKKESIFFINLNYKLPENIKISVKKPANLKDEEVLEWVKTALICEKSDMDFNIEKRSIGYDRIQELINPEIVIKNNFLLFSINISNIESKNDNVIIITQNNNNLSKFEPEEIYLYQEKIS